MKNKRFKDKKKIKDHLNLPYCFYPNSYEGYHIHNISNKNSSITANLKRLTHSSYPSDVDHLLMQFFFETPHRLRIKIFDPFTERWEPPVPEVPGGLIASNESALYKVKLNPNDATFTVTRTSTRIPVFDTVRAAPLTFADQFLQISTYLSSDYIYGLGQHIEGLVLDTLWQQRVLWNLDQYPLPDRNLYGSHPFYLNMEPTGDAHGVLVLNSNALDAVIQPSPAVTFHAIGGIFDIYVFMGPTPDDVVKQYMEVIGMPFLPPYWSLGYHQCRFGYGSLNRTKQVWKQTRDAGIPFDVQWNDIDYMDKYNDFTYDKVKFKGLPEFVDEVHEAGMHYIPIIDPGISASEPAGTYPPYDDGFKAGIFIRNQSNLPFIGKVWNRATTTWPDFTHPSSIYWWSRQMLRYHNQVKYDGAWIDMNEPSNFWSGQKHGCSKNNLDDPFYMPPVYGGKLCYHTVCMDAKHRLGHHYDLHNLYSFTETIATNVGLKVVTGKRPFIISRATFPGQGKYGGHWTGDVVSDWKNLWLSISDILNFNMFGIPMVGADICGFNGNTTASLCLRWMQLGAFYPFARNHNEDTTVDQDPVSLGRDVVIASRQAFQQRYTLLPYLYTLFFKAFKTGSPVARPLFFEFPHVKETYTLDTQFLWGSGLMIVPALEENVNMVRAFLPGGIWYDWYTGKVIGEETPVHVILDAPLDSIPLLLLGGNVLPTQLPGNTTTESRKNPFRLQVALDVNGQASGELFWDDGDTLDAILGSVYTYIKFKCENNSLVNSVVYLGYESNMKLDYIRVLGVESDVSTVSVNNQDVKFDYRSDTKVLEIHGFTVPIYESFTVTWK